MSGTIFYILGKSATGKDHLYQNLLADAALGLKGVVPYTTRPMREGEADGETYFFVTDEQMAALRASGRVIESRTYQTVLGPWTYATVDDGQFDVPDRDFLLVGVLNSFLSVRDYFGADRVIPVYLEVPANERLARSIRREQLQEEPDYEEIVRRFNADEADFSEENLRAGGIVRRFANTDYGRCLDEVRAWIRSGGRA